MWTRPYPAPLLLGAILGTQAIAAAIAAYGFLVTPIPWSYIGLIWAYCLAWVFVEDLAKLAVYRHLDRQSRRHRGFLDTLGGRLH
jgi:H+-transporting ATPase